MSRRIAVSSIFIWHSSTGGILGLISVMFKNFLFFAGMALIVSLACAGSFAYAKETSKPSPTPKPSFESINKDRRASRTDTPLVVDSSQQDASASDSVTPTPVSPAPASASAAPTPTPTPSPSATPTPSSPGKQLALGFMDLFKKSGPTDSSGTKPGLNVLSADMHNSPYADGSGMSTAATRSLYGVVVALGLLGAFMIWYERSHRIA